MPLPNQYAWLAKEPGPKMLLEGLKLFGTVETPGAGNNPAIIAWAKETGVQSDYTADSIPWCGLYMAVVAKRAGKTFPAAPLWALNWGNWGDDAGQPELGDVLVFVRPGGGHVGMYVGEDAGNYHVLGGNTSDQVMIARIDKHRLYAARRPHWEIAEPPNRRPIILAATGEVSRNEA